MIEYRIRDTSTMLKLFYVIFMNLHRAPYMIPRMRAEADHPQRFRHLNIRFFYTGTFQFHNFTPSQIYKLCIL